MQQQRLQQLQHLEALHWMQPEVLLPLKLLLWSSACGMRPPRPLTTQQRQRQHGKRSCSLNSQLPRQRHLLQQLKHRLLAIRLLLVMAP